jgi:hypothetical protein
VFSITMFRVIEEGPLVITMGSASWNSRWGRPTGVVGGGVVGGGVVGWGAVVGGCGGQLGQVGHVHAPPIMTVPASRAARPRDRTRFFRSSPMVPLLPIALRLRARRVAALRAPSIGPDGEDR